MIDYTNLIEFASQRQLDYIEAIHKAGSHNKAAKALGVGRRSIDASIKRLTKAAAKRSPAMHDYTKVIPEPYLITGVSQYDPVQHKWVKSRLDDEGRIEAIKSAFADFLEGVGPISVPPAPLDFQTDVIPWIQIGDAHIGMLAHASETGKDFNLDTAERELCGAISILIDELPNCERIVINDLGDATHYDNLSATTSASGHALDADGRRPSGSHGLEYQLVVPFREVFSAGGEFFFSHFVLQKIMMSDEIRRL